MPHPVLVGLDTERPDRAPLFVAASLARATGAPLIALGAYRHDSISNAVSSGTQDGELRVNVRRGLESVVGEVDADLLDAAAELALAVGATLEARTAIEPLDWRPSPTIAPHGSDGFIETSTANVQRAFDEALARVPQAVRVSSDVVVSRAADALIDLSQHVDLIVYGSRGYGPVRSVLREATAT